MSPLELTTRGLLPLGVVPLEEGKKSIGSLEALERATLPDGGGPAAAPFKGEEPGKKSG
jgi:hypothetical protein